MNNGTTYMLKYVHGYLVCEESGVDWFLLEEFINNV